MAKVTIYPWSYHSTLVPMLLLSFFVTLLCVCNVWASFAFGNSTRKKTMTFETQEHLVKSTFWQDVLWKPQFINPNSTSIFIADKGSILMFPRQYREYSRLMFWRKPRIHLIEVQLGEKNFKTYDVIYYPLVTFSAEWSTSGAILEREVGTGYGVKYSLDKFLEQDIVTAGGSYGLVTTQGRISLGADSVVCRVHAGGKGQLQVSSRLKHFPEARFRKVICFNNIPDFHEEKWEKIRTSLVGESHDGVVIYEDWNFSKHRCVTDPYYFEDAKTRRWIN